MTNRTMDFNQDLEEWRGRIEDECVRLKSSGDETALEALLWVLEDVLPNPEDTEHQSVSQTPRYVVAVNGRISAAAMAESFATFDDAADEAREMSFAAPGRNYKVIEVETPAIECKSVAHQIDWDRLIADLYSLEREEWVKWGPTQRRDYLVGLIKQFEDARDAARATERRSVDDGGEG